STVHNPYRSRHSRRQDRDRQAAGVGEFRAVAERLLETGAQYLEQGREWLHAATRGQSQDQQRATRDSHAPFGGERAGGRHWDEGHDDHGPYAPDEYSFSETGGVFDTRGGRRNEGPGAPG